MAQAAIRLCQRTTALAVLTVFICFGLSIGGSLAQKSKAAEDTLEAFDHNNFDNSATVDNKWFPLQPGTQLVYKGFTQEDEKRVPARVVQTVTDLTKLVNGVRTVVVWDVDHKDSKVTESEIVSSRKTRTATSGCWVSWLKYTRMGTSRVVAPGSPAWTARVRES